MASGPVSERNAVKMVVDLKRPAICDSVEVRGESNRSFGGSDVCDLRLMLNRPRGHEGAQEEGKMRSDQTEAGVEQDDKIG